MLPGRDPDALTPDVVASRSFGFAKRGYEAREVQDFLREVAEELRVLRSHAAELSGQLDATRTELTAARELDEDQLAEALGEETKAVLSAARTAAASIRSRAEDERTAAMAQAAEDAEEIRAAARADADRIRAETEQEVAGHLQAAATTVAEAREEAVATAEQATVAAAETVEQARQRGREMVAEAQAVRERMLKDLARRRKVLRQQIDQLQAGRDRLLAAYDVVLRTATEATGEMGEVLEAAREAAQAAARASGSSTADADLDIIAAIEQVRLERGLVAEALDPEELERVDEPVSEEVPVVEAEGAEEVADRPADEGAGGAVAAEALPPPPEGAEEPAGAEEAVGEAGAAVEALPPPPEGAEEPAGAEEAVGEAGAAVEALPPPPEGAEEPADAEEAVGEDEGELPPEAATALGDEDADVDADSPATGGRGGRGDRRRSLFGRAGGDVPKAPPPAEHEGRFSSAVRVFARDGEEEGVPLEAVDEAGVAGAAADEAVGDQAGPAPASGSRGLFDRLRQEQAASRPPVDEQAEEEAPVEADEPGAAAGDGGVEEGAEVAAPSDGAADEGPVEAPAEAEGEHPAGDEGEPGGDAALLAQRDAALATLDATLRRRLKRTLADEENEVLDALRRHTGQVDADLLLPSAEDHLRRYADATLPTLAACAAGGVDFLQEGWPDLVAEAPRTRVGDLAEGAAEDLVVPLRQALARQVAGAPDDTDALLQVVRDTYRDWRHARIEPVARQVAATAFHRALAEHVAEGTRLRWVLGGPGEPSPDCGANAEAEPVVRGEPFPDGSTVPPCGAGCRCLVVPEA